VEFEWDDEKARSNLEKHGVSFEVAKKVFEDVFRGERPSDDDAADGEERWVTTGLAGSFELVVVYAIRGNKVRVISARKAERDEREEYWRDRC
jgi:uncharacterized DUF497 family protein